jgi:outer membrane protein
MAMYSDYRQANTALRRLSAVVVLILLFPFVSVGAERSSTVTGETNQASIEKPTLAECISRALEKNLLLVQASIKIENRVQEIREVRAVAYPQLKFDGNYTRLGNLTKIDMGDGQKISFTPADNYSLKLALNQILYAGGQVKAALRLAGNAKEAVELERQLAKETVILLTGIDFYNAMLTDEMVKVAEDTVSTVSAHLENVKKMKEQDLVSEFDLLRASVALSNIQPLLISSRNQREIAYARLADMVQWPGKLEAISGIFEEELFTYDEDSILPIALEHRWELKILDSSLRIAEENLAISRGDKKPSVVFFGNYDWSNDNIDLMTGNGEWNEGWNFGIQAGWHLFDGFAAEAKIARSKGDVRLAEIEKTKTVNSIRLEVIEALNNYREAVELRQSQGKNVEQAAKSLHIAEVRFQQGISTQLEVMDSTSALTVARSQYLQAMHGFSLAKITLEKVMGILLEDWTGGNLGKGAGKETDGSMDSGHDQGSNEVPDK